MAISKDNFFKLLDLLGSDDEEKEKEKETPPAPPAPKAPEPKEMTKEELEAALAAINGAETPPVKKEEPKAPPAEKEGETEREKELREKLEAQELARVQTSIESGLVAGGIDKENFEAVKEFFAYDKLRGEDGSADDEKITELVDALASLALRTPPKSGARDVYDPSQEGLAKYL